MLSIMPGVSDNDTKRLLAILEVLPVDGKYRERLAELIDKAKEANAAIAALRTEQRTAADTLTAAEAMRRSVEEETSRMQQEVVTERKKVEAAYAQLVEREAEHQKQVAKDAAHNQKANDELAAKRESSKQEMADLRKARAELQQGRQKLAAHLQSAVALHATMQELHRLVSDEE